MAKIMSSIFIVFLFGTLFIFPGEALSFFGKTENILSSYKNIINVLVAFGTLFTAFGAFYFGLIGKYETRLLLRREEDELDRIAFEFLTNTPANTTIGLDKMIECGQGNVAGAEFINEFEKKVLAYSYIGNSKLRKYNIYIGLAKEMLKYPVSHDGYDCESRKRIFNKIKSEAEKIHNKIDSKTRLISMQKLWDHEASFFWNKTIYYISPVGASKSHPRMLVYYDKNISDRDMLKEIADINLKMAIGMAENDRVYNTTDLNDCRVLHPTHYELIKVNENSITMEYVGKRIVLQYKKPMLLS
jgi:hypothetical protein